MEQEVLLLNKIGLSDTEAKVYLTLLQRGSLSGYETSKFAGIPRSKIYNILETLIQKGFILYTEAENGNKYSAVSIQQVVEKAKQETKDVFEDLTQRLSTFPQTTNMDEIWHIKNVSNIFVKCRELISQAQEEILLQVWEDDIPYIMEELLEQEKNGLKMGIIVFSDDKDLQLPLKKYSRHGLVTQKKEEMGGRWINLIADEQEVVFGQIITSDMAEVIWTRSKPMLFLAAEYIRHDLYFY